MAATFNTNANAALSPVSAGEAVGSPHTPPRRTSFGAAKSSPPWNRVVREPEVEGMVDLPPPLSESLVSAVVPAAAEVDYDQNSVLGKSGSSPEGSEAETQPEGSNHGNGSKKPAWNKTYKAAPDNSLVMGAVSWPTLFESTKASPKPPSTDSLKITGDAPISMPQVAAANASSSVSASSPVPQKQMTSNPNPNATQHHGRPARQKSMKCDGGGNSSSNGGFSHPFPHSNSVGNTSHTSNSSLKIGSGGSENSGREHWHNNATGDGGQRSGGDHSQQRNYRRSNSGPHLRGDGSFGVRRDQDRGNHDWNHHRSFSGRSPPMPPQRVGPMGFVRTPPPAAAAAYVPLPIRPYGSPMEMQPLYYFAPNPAMPFVAQMPPAVYYPQQDPQLHAKIINQIDYYFSNENLIKDTYLRQYMDEHGWVPIQLIANFKNVMQLTTDIQLVLDAVRASTVLEIQGDKIRKRDDWMRWIMPPSAQFSTAAGSQSPRMLQDTLPARVQGLALEENTPNYSN